MLISLYHYHFFTYSTSRIFIGLFFLTCTHTIILFNNDFLTIKNFIKDHVNRHLSQLIYDTNLFDNNFNLFIMFLTNFNSSVEFTVCSAMPSGEESYFMESSPPIYIINLWTVFSMVRDVSGGYSQTDWNDNFNINVNITVDSYMNSSFTFSFLHLLKCLLAFTIMKLKSTSKITT